MATLTWQRSVDRATAGYRYQSKCGRYDIRFRPHGWLLIVNDFRVVGTFESVAGAKRASLALAQKDNDE